MTCRSWHIDSGRSMSGLPAYLSAAFVCLTGLMETTPETGDRDLWFVCSVLALLGCALVTWVFNIRRIRVGMVDMAAAVLLIWYLFCYFVHGSIASSKLLEICFFAMLYVALRIVLSSYRNIANWLIVVISVCGIVEAVVGIRQSLGMGCSVHSLFNVTGTFFNPGPYGGYIAVILALAAGYVACRWRYAERLFGGFKGLRNISIRRILWALGFVVTLCAAISIVIILPSTMSRAAFVATIVAALAMALTDKRVRMYIVSYARRHAAGAVAIGIALTLFVCAGAYGVYSLKRDSADGRLLMWKIGAKVIARNPVTGVGQGYYLGAFGDVQAGYFGTGERSEAEIRVAGSPEYGFNEYLSIGAETGLVGLGLFVFLATAALWRLFRSGSPYAFGLMALLVFALFSYPFDILPMQVLLVLFLVVAGSSTSGRKDAAVAHRVVVGVILAGCAGAAPFITGMYAERVEAAKEWRQLRRWYDLELYSDVVEDYRRLFPLMKENPAFMFEYGRSLYIEERYRESLDVLIPATRLSSDPMFYNVVGNAYKALGEYDKAAGAYLKAYCIVPHRMYPLYLLGKMYAETGDEANAARYARMVVEMIPKVGSPATRDMQREMKELLERLRE